VPILSLGAKGKHREDNVPAVNTFTSLIVPATALGLKNGELKKYTEIRYAYSIEDVA